MNVIKILLMFMVLMVALPLVTAITIEDIQFENGNYDITSESGYLSEDSIMHVYADDLLFSVTLETTDGTTPAIISWSSDSLQEENGYFTTGDLSILSQYNDGDTISFFIAVQDMSGNLLSSSTFSDVIIDSSSPSFEDDIAEENYAITPNTLSAVTTLSVYVSDNSTVDSVSIFFDDGTTTQTSPLTFDSVDESGVDIWVTDFDPSSFDEGTIDATITATDIVGNVETLAYSIYYDTVAPTILAVTDATVFENSYTIEATIDDNFVDSLTVYCLLDITGPDTSVVDYSFEITELTTTAFESASTYDELGDYTYQIDCYDEMYTVSSQTYTFSVVDTLAPTITFNSPSDNVVMSASTTTFDIDVTVTDNIGADSFSITITDSQGNIVEDSSIASGFSGSYTDTVTTSDVPDETYTIVVESSDLSGNTATSEIDFTIDTTAPVVELTSEAYVWSSFSEAILSFTNVEAVSDYIFCEVSLDSTGLGTYTAYSPNVESTVAITSDDWTDSGLNAPNTADEFTTYLTCYDALTNTAVSNTATINWEDAGPEISFVTPTEYGAYMYDPAIGGTQSIDLELSITDTIGTVASATYTMTLPDGTTSSAALTNSVDDTWVATESVSELGTYALEVTAIDNAGLETTQSTTFYVDGVEPEIVSVSPETGSLVTFAQVFTVTATDEGSYVDTVYITDGIDSWSTTYTTVGQTEFEVTVDLENYAEADEITLSVYAEDVAFLVSDYETLIVTLDANAPDIDSFTCNDVTQNADADCTCTATDTYDGVATDVETTVTADTSSTGEITATCSTSDAAGNTATSETTFTVSAPVTSTSSGGGGGGGSSSSRSECEDNRDNDGDGLFDLDDPGCTNGNDDSETDIVCTESWTCTSYSTCSVDGSQDRSCYDINSCELKESRGQVDVIQTSARLDESRSCTFEVTASPEEVEVEDPVVEESIVEETNSANLLTGAITGIFDGGIKDLAKPAVIIFAIAVLVGLGIFARKKFK